VDSIVTAVTTHLDSVH